MWLIMDDFLSEFNAHLSSPQSYLNPTEDFKQRSRNALKTMFDLYKSFAAGKLGNIATQPGCKNIDTGPLPELYVDGLDNDQIWEQIELVNKPVIKGLTGTVGRLSSQIESGQFRLLPQSDASSGAECAGNGTETGVSESVEEERDYLADESEDCVDSEDEDIELESDDESGRGNGCGNGRGKAQERGRSSVVDDKFFKLAEMEKFLEMAEKEEIRAPDEPSDSEEDEDIDYFEDGTTNLEGEESDCSHRGPLYGDFFDPPDKEVVLGVGKGRKGVRFEGPGVEGDGGVSSEGGGGDAESGEEWGVMDTAEGEEEEEGEGPVEEEGRGRGEEEGDKLDDGEKLSKHQKKLLMMQSKISTLESANLAQKTWQMGGETSAKKRPMNSLLEEDLSFDHMSRPAPMITEETTKLLEDVIKQRIIDEVWDDVVRRIKPVEKPYDYSKSRPLDQEKSKLSLAEVYEQEYVKQTQEAGAEGEEKEDQRHVEVKEMITKLFYKLDALSNFHFTPKPPRPEVTIVANVPAIQMEEVAPVATSEATLLAPEELQAKSRRPAVGSTEKTDTDRKRERRLKKKHKRMKVAEKKKRERVADKLRPGLGNKYSKKALVKRLKEREGEEAVDKSLQSSSRFFAKMQEQVKEQVKSAKDTRRPGSNRHRTSVQQYKL